MKNLIIILISLLSVSCLTVKRIERNCDKFAKICEVPVKKEVKIIRDVHIETIYRDTIIYVKVPGKTVKKKVPVYINKGVTNSGRSVLSVPFATGWAQVVNSKLIHELTQTDTILRVKLENALKHSKILEKENKILKEKSVTTIVENTKWAKLCIKVVWVVIILGIGFLVIKYKHKIWSLLKLVRKLIIGI